MKEKSKLFHEQTTNTLNDGSKFFIIMKNKCLYVLFTFMLFINRCESVEEPPTSKCKITLLKEEDDHKITDASSDFLVYELDISKSQNKKYDTKNSNIFLPYRWYSAKVKVLTELQLLYGVYTSIFKNVYHMKYRELSVNVTPTGCFYNLKDDELENVTRTFFWNEVRDGNDNICSAHVYNDNGVGNLFFRCCRQTGSQNNDCIDIEQHQYLLLMNSVGIVTTVLAFMVFAYFLFHKIFKNPILSKLQVSQCIKNKVKMFQFVPQSLKLKRTVNNTIEVDGSQNWIINNEPTEKWNKFVKIEIGETVNVKALKIEIKRKNTIDKDRMLMDVFEYVQYLANKSCWKSCKCKGSPLGLYLIWLVFSIISLIPLFLTIELNKDEIPCEVYRQKSLDCPFDTFQENTVNDFLIGCFATFLCSMLLVLLLNCIIFKKEKKVILAFFLYIVYLLSTIPCCILIHFITYFIIRFVFTCFVSGDKDSNVSLFTLPLACFFSEIFTKTINHYDSFVEDIVKLHKEAKFIYSRICINANEAVTFTVGEKKDFIGQLYFESDKLKIKLNQPLIFLPKDGEFHISRKFVCEPFPDIEMDSARKYNKLLLYSFLLLLFFSLLMFFFIQFNTIYSHSSTFISYAGYAALIFNIIHKWLTANINKNERDCNYRLLEDYKNIYATYSETWTVTELVTESYSFCVDLSKSDSSSNQDHSVVHGADPEPQFSTSITLKNGAAPIQDNITENVIVPVSSLSAITSTITNHSCLAEKVSDSSEQAESTEMKSTSRIFLKKGGKPKKVVSSTIQQSEESLLRKAKPEHQNYKTINNSDPTEMNGNKKYINVSQKKEDERCLIDKESDEQ